MPFCSIFPAMNISQSVMALSESTKNTAMHWLSIYISIPESTRINEYQITIVGSKKRYLHLSNFQSNNGGSTPAHPVRRPQDMASRRLHPSRPSTQHQLRCQVSLRKNLYAWSSSPLVSDACGRRTVRWMVCSLDSLFVILKIRVH